MEAKNISFLPVLKAGLIAAFIGAGLNNIWSVIAGALGATVPLTFAVMVTISSFIPVLVAAIIYFVLVRFVPRGAMVFTVVGVLFLLYSFYPVFTTTSLPNGTILDDTFPFLVGPMHVFSGGLALYGIPKWSR